ncbi:MAG TPA: nitroreductase family protein [Thermomicrobiales bacterium]|nr:nitroreductase family protein [Thermomicrobiales bacterium]
MDAYLNIVSKRDVRKYRDEPIPDEVLTRILHGGRATGSARNRQQWEMVVVRSRETLERLAETVAAPANIRGCAAAVAVVLKGQSAWDGGRMAQNLMLAAWSQGVGTCPNSPVQKDECKAILGVAADADILTILSLGYPAEPVPRASDADAILARIDRKPLEELTRYID